MLWESCVKLKDMILFENIDYTEVNDVQSASASIEHLMDAYRRSKANEAFRTFRPRKTASNRRLPVI